MRHSQMLTMTTRFVSFALAISIVLVFCPRQGHGQVPVGPEIDLGQIPVGPEIDLRAEARNPMRRVYVEYDGVLYPVQGFVRRANNKIERVDAAPRRLERVDPGREIELSDNRRSDPRFIEVNGASLARSQFLLPPPGSPNDLFHSRVSSSETRMGHARALEGIGFSSAPDKMLLTRFRASPQFGAAFDTGFVGPGFDVANVALGSDPRSGQTRFTGSEAFMDNVPVSLLFDNQILDIGNENQLQFYVEANNHDRRDELRLEHIFARVWDKEAMTFGVGKTHSLFGVGGLAPATLIQQNTLIGTGDLNSAKRAQFRLQRAMGGDWAWGVAIEDPYDRDYTITGTKLTRWPTLAANFAFKTADDAEDRLRLSALVRNFGFQAPTGEEHFTTGWGLSAYARFPFECDDCSSGNFYIGVAGGEGIGRYIHGVNTSAVFGAGNFASLKGFGTYMGYTRNWRYDDGMEYSLNAAYGFATMESSPFVTDPAMESDELHQAWVNFLVSPNDQVAIGFEYQYGMRETIAGARGENHRFMFVIALNLGKTENITSIFRDENGQPLDIGEEAREAQSGRSGAAYRQGL